MIVQEVILKSVRDLLRIGVLKEAFLIGVPLAMLWFVFGYISWDFMVDFTEKFISWIPFSMLRANGAFLLGSFIWISVVLVTYALIVSIFNFFIINKLDRKYYTAFSLLLLLFVSLSWAIFAFSNWDIVYKEVLKVLNWFPFKTIEMGVASMLAVLIFYNSFIVSESMLLLFFRKNFLINLQKKDYDNINLVSSEQRVSFTSVAFRDFFIFLGLLLISFPLMFVPFINIITQVILWAWLIKESYFLSVGSLYIQKYELDNLREYQTSLWGLAILGSLLNLIPVINILAPFFTQILFFHWMMLKKS